MVAIQLSGIYLPSLIFSLMRTPKSGVPLPELAVVESEYDYVIVGSGWGGSVLANRLSQDANTKVLLLEAGTRDNVSTEIPLLALTQHGDGYDWQYKTTPQKHMCWGNSEKRCKMAAGKVAGGTSTIGEVVHTRGNKEDFDKLGKILPGWSYQDVLPFYKKSEDFHNQQDQCVEDEENSCGGEVYIGPSPPGTKSITTSYFIDAVKEILHLKEINSIRDEPGIDLGHYFMKKGVRVNAASAFLKPIAHTRKNLHISLDSFVNKIVIDSASKKAIGVEFEKNGVVRRVVANKEVLLSAGVYQSPKILMLSGIGPKEHLEKFNISVVMDLPGVGQNYMDLPFTPIFFASGRNISKDRETMFDVETFSKWRKGNGGMLATPTGIDAGFSWRSSLANPNTTGPDLAMVYQSLELHPLFAYYLQRALGYSDEIWNSILAPDINKDTVNIQTTFGLPDSKGTIQLQSSDPKDHPIIDPNFYGDEEEQDLNTMAAGVRLTMKFENATSFQEHNYKLHPRTFEECAQFQDRESIDYLRCFFKYSSFPRWCSCCSNKMGPQSDRLAVVDDRLRVYGISNLRVVDASVLPNHFRAPPSATVIMVGEKAAHMIKEDNQ